METDRFRRVSRVQIVNQYYVESVALTLFVQVTIVIQMDRGYIYISLPPQKKMNIWSMRQFDDFFSNIIHLPTKFLTQLEHFVGDLNISRHKA